MNGKQIAFFPEAAFGPALNSVGVEQACENLGHKVVCLTDAGQAGRNFRAHAEPTRAYQGSQHSQQSVGLKPSVDHDHVVTKSGQWFVAFFSD